MMLSRQGKADMYYLAKRYRSRFPQLFSQGYSQNLFQVSKTVSPVSNGRIGLTQGSGEVVLGWRPLPASIFGLNRALYGLRRRRTRKETKKWSGSSTSLLQGLSAGNWTLSPPSSTWWGSSRREVEDESVFVSIFRAPILLTLEHRDNSISSRQMSTPNVSFFCSFATPTPREPDRARTLLQKVFSVPNRVFGFQPRSLTTRFLDLLTTAQRGLTKSITILLLRESMNCFWLVWKWTMWYATSVKGWDSCMI